MVQIVTVHQHDYGSSKRLWSIKTIMVQIGPSKRLWYRSDTEEADDDGGDRAAEAGGRHHIRGVDPRGSHNLIQGIHSTGRSITCSKPGRAQAFRGKPPITSVPVDSGSPRKCPPLIFLQVNFIGGGQNLPVKWGGGALSWRAEIKWDSARTSRKHRRISARISLGITLRIAYGRVVCIIQS